MTKCHTADLNNVSSSVWFRQSTHNHVSISNRLHLNDNSRRVRIVEPLSHLSVLWSGLAKLSIMTLWRHTI